MAVYVLLVYPDDADYESPAQVQEVVGLFGTEREAHDHAKNSSEILKFDILPLEFPT